MRWSDEHSPRTVGRYVLHGEVASGGMATVHFGRLSGPVGFSRTVAIKRLHPHFAKDPEFVTMFLDEARLCGRIRHPNVVPTLDVVTTHGEIFIVMEYVAGEAFSRLLKNAQSRNVAIPPKVVATVISSVLHGLHAAHGTKDEQGNDLGIVHRDVSPQNILVGIDGAARVLDFGVAKATGRLQTTRDGQLKGKIAYMPPEQLAGAPVTTQVDVYAASVVLWEALTGRRLFDGETEAITLARAIEGHIDPPSHHNTLIDRSIDELVLRGLSRDPQERWGTAREMALAIERTMGLASPSAVTEWVESVCGEELHQRAKAVAAIEVEGGHSASHAGVPPEPHSQVSSISVSRPAISFAPPRALSRAKVMVSVLGVLALVGGGLGFRAVREAFGGVRHPEPRQLEADAKRELARTGPASAPEKASREQDKPSSASAAAAPNPRVQHGRPSPGAAKANNCDPPFTFDQATGRKKYKLECLH